MSYGDAPKPRSPWFYVGIGCASVAAVSFVGCIAGGLWLGSRFKDVMAEAQKPVSVQEIKTAFQGIPLYPNGTIETNETYRTMRSTFKLMARTGLFQSVDLAMLTVTDSEETVNTWYEKKLTALGYMILTSSTQSQQGRTVKMVQYSKGSDLIVIQLSESAVPQNKSQQMLMVIHFTGAKKGFTYQQ